MKFKLLIIVLLLSQKIIAANAGFPWPVQYFVYPIYQPYPGKASATMLLSRPLIIETNELSEKEREKLSKKDPEALEFQEAYGMYFQQSLKYYFETKYTGSKEIKFMSPAEVDKIVESGTDKYAILRNGNADRCYQMNGKDMCKSTFSFYLYLSEDPKAKVIISYTEDILSDIDFLFLVQQLNKILKDASNEVPSANYSGLNNSFKDKIKGKTLLVPESILNEKLTKEDIRKEYTLPVEFLSDTVYQNKIKSETKDYVYLTGSFCPSLHGYVCWVVDAETGEVILAMSSGGVTFYVGTRPSRSSMQMMYPNPGHIYTMEERNKFSTTLFQTKGKFDIKKSYFGKMMNHASKK